MPQESMAMADYTFKIIIIGQSGVGKTSIIRRYVRRQFQHEQPTIGVDIGIKLIKIGNSKIQLKVWDSAGAERFKSLTTSYYRNSDAAILVYSINKPETLHELQSWSRETCNHGDMLRILVGNKTDLEEERMISQQSAIDFALLENINLAVECSAKLDDNVDYIFHTVAEKLLNIEKEKQRKTKLLEHRGSVLRYEATSKSMENLFISHNITKKHAGKESEYNLENFKRKNVFQKFCTIL